MTHSILSMDNRNQDDYFFNKSDLEKMEYFSRLTSRYRLCKKVYYYFNSSSNLWIEEKTDDSIIHRICQETAEILLPEKKAVFEILTKLQTELNQKKQQGKITVDEMKDLDEVVLATKEFTKYIDKNMKEHQKSKFACSVIKFFNHNISDTEFMDKININNQHLLPLKTRNYNFKTMKMEDRIPEQFFTKALNFDDIPTIDINDDNYKKVDKFFLDIATGYEPKKDYLQKVMGYFLTGAVPIGRSFYIFYGEGKNGKSAVMEILNEVMGYYCKAIDTSVIIKKGIKNSGQPSPEIEVLDYGLRLGILSETDDGDKLNETLLKNISGYDSISYRALYGVQKEFKSEAKLCMLTNNKPFFKLSESMTDRLRFTSFNSRFITEDEINKQGGLKENQYKVDRDLVQDLKTIYRNYVLYWMLIGSKKVYDEGHMNIPDDKILQLENMSYILEMDTYKRFVDECLTIDEHSKELSSHVQDAYKKFCVDESIPAIKPSKLKELLSKQFKITKTSNNYYCGFKIKTNEEDEEINTNPLDD
jgi:putative DNA primase/helicase